MPLFEYLCARCGTTFEALVRSSSPQPIACPHCQSVHVQKQMSSFAVKGSGGSGGAGAQPAACAPGGG